jgi:hypothetical protein
MGPDASLAKTNNVLASRNKTYGHSGTINTKPDQSFTLVRNLLGLVSCLFPSFLSADTMPPCEIPPCEKCGADSRYRQRVWSPEGRNLRIYQCTRCERLGFYIIVDNQLRPCP